MTKSLIFGLVILLPSLSLSSVGLDPMTKERFDLGIEETPDRIVKTTRLSNGVYEIVTIFKDDTKKLSWALKNVSQAGRVFSRTHRYCDGSKITENFSQAGRVTSRLTTNGSGYFAENFSKYGKTTFSKKSKNYQVLVKNKINCKGTLAQRNTQLQVENIGRMKNFVEKELKESKRVSEKVAQVLRSIDNEKEFRAFIKKKRERLATKKQGVGVRFLPPSDYIFVGQERVRARKKVQKLLGETNYKKFLNYILAYNQGAYSRSFVPFDF